MNNEVLVLLRTAINALETARKWEQMAMLKAQGLGLQGEKRRNRCNSSKTYDLIKYYQTVACDLFNECIVPEEANVSQLNANDFKGYFEAYKSKLVKIYNALHDVANKFVVANCKTLACPLYELTDCYFDDIVEVNRVIKEGTVTNWNPIFVLPKQITAENVHDSQEKREEDRGYKY